MNTISNTIQLWKEKKYVKLLIISFCVLVFFNFFMFIPLSRRLLIKLLELVFQKEVKIHSHWMKYFIDYTLLLDFLYFSICLIFSIFLTDDNKVYAFFFICYISVFFIITNIESSLGNFTGYYNNWDFGDFTPSITNFYGPNDVLIYGTNYPPLAVLFYKLLYTFMPSNQYSNTDVLNYLLTLNFLFITLSLSLLFRQLFIKLDKYSIPLSLVLFITGPILFTYGRFNIAFLALIFTIVFVLYYKSDNRILKELSLISLAIAANIKLYPAVFGLCLLAQKQWKESLRCILYAVTLFFFPLIFQENAGFIDTLIKGISSFTSIPNGISLMAILSNIGIGIKFQYIILTFYVLITFLAYFITSKEYQKYLLLTLLCILIPKVSYFYSLIFLIIPFSKLLEQKAFSVCDKLIFLLLTFSFIFSYNFFSILIPNYRIILILVFLILFIDIFRNFCKKVLLSKVKK